MNLSRPFILRPVATSLLMLALLLSGLLGLRLLPIAPLPQVDLPTISVSASLPGASPEVMAATVATPLERSLGSIAGVTEMTSRSSLGQTRVTLQFDLSRDQDGAAREVQAALLAARTLLPAGLPNNPSYRKVNPASAPILILALTSPTFDRGQMYDVAATILAQKLAQVAGVGQVDVSGSSLPAVRVALNPRALERLGIGVEQVRSAVAGNNANRPKGLVENEDLQWWIGANDQAMTAAAYRSLLLAWRDGAPVTLGDVAEVTDSVQDVRNAGLANGQPAVMLQVRQQPGANIVATVERIRDLLPQLRAAIPAAVQLDLVMDRSVTIRASLEDVGRTLVIAVLLVIGVVWLFLRDARLAALPAVAIPISLIGSCGLLYLAGFSLNLLTLMALTVAAGFVVDDAVVVVENICRHLERGRSPLEAALAGAREVGFTVLSMSLSLIAVFLPIVWMGGMVGRFIREFGTALSVAILVSLLVSLTATPMLAARWLRPAGTRPPGRLSQALGAGQARLEGGYGRSLDWALAHPRLVLALLLATVGLNIYLYVLVPKGFLPQQDTGRLLGNLQMDQSASFQATQTKLTAFVEILRADPAIANLVAYTGSSGSGFLFATLKPRAERGLSSEALIARLRPKLAKVSGARLFLQSAQDLRIGGRSSDSQYQYSLRSDDLDDLRLWEPRLRQALAQLPELTDVSTDERDRGLQTRLTIDRDSAARLGVKISTLTATLNDLFGQRQVSTLYHPLNQYKVVLEAAAPFRQGPEALDGLHIRSDAGQLVPLASLARWEAANAPLSVNHQGLAVASTISFNLPVGGSLSDAERAIRDASADLNLPATLRGGFQGTAKAYQDSLRDQPVLILAALLTLYILLGILYESYLHPLTILSTLPSAGVGALLALLALGDEFNLVAFIGVILLVGIVKKNAIMMIDVALVLGREQGMAAREAIAEAGRRRFRPILMTTLAAMLGAVPLMIGMGEGAELRRPLGISIFGGLLVSQVLTLYTTPILFLYLERARSRVLAWHQRLRTPPDRDPSPCP